MTHICPVILAGGTGSRLWPASRRNYPKQFMKFTGDDTLLQESAIRLAGVTDTSPLLVCSSEHRFLAAEQLVEIGLQDAAILLEPSSRNTTAAIACAAWYLHEKDPDAIMVVMPADHMVSVSDREGLQSAIKIAATYAESNRRIVTLGIKPTYAETGYGYIQAKLPETAEVNTVYDVDRFIEKPDASAAEELAAKNDCFWNSGIYIMQVSRILAELETHEPEIHSHCKAAVLNSEIDLDFVRLEEKRFDACRDISIDYSVMEKVNDLAVLPYHGEWSDIGSWDGLLRYSKSDDSGNYSQGDVIIQDCDDCLAYSTSRLVAVKGLTNVCVVETDDAVYVVDRSMAQKTKEVVDALRSRKREEVDTHKTVYRPWGHYTSLKHGERYQVKRITVKPGAKLSLQKHFHRSEHWVVVSGTAEVTNGDREILLYENESTYIPIGSIHRLYNPGAIPLELIEVQSGSYLGEDDIVRIGDEYGRS